MLRLRRRFCAARGLECYNNRLFKRGDRLELRLASAAPRAREDRWPSSSRLTRSAAFARLLLRLNAAPRTERSRLFVWVVDTTNEVRGDNAVRYLLPAAALHAITLNAPSVRLSWSSSRPHP